MKKVVSVLAILATAIGSSIVFPGVAEARPATGQTGFWCEESGGQYPTTMYQNSNGGSEPWIRWASWAMAGSGYDPYTRCREVSGRLETYRRNHQLVYITAGRMNNQNVICTASVNSGRCEGLIYTLHPGADVIETLMTLLAWRDGQAYTPSLYESGEIPYIYVADRLEDGAASTTPTTTTTPSNSVQPSTPPTSSGGMREL